MLCVYVTSYVPGLDVGARPEPTPDRRPCLLVQSADQSRLKTVDQVGMLPFARAFSLDRMDVTPTGLSCVHSRLSATRRAGGHVE